MKIVDCWLLIADWWLLIDDDHDDDGGGDDDDDANADVGRVPWIKIIPTFDEVH